MPAGQRADSAEDRIKGGMIMTGITSSFLAAAKLFHDSDSFIVFLIVAPCLLAFALMPAAIVLHIFFPDKFVFGFNYALNAKKQNSRGYTSEQLAEMILKYGGVSDVSVLKSEDEWGHSFEPDMNAVVLSKPFYGKSDMRSVCAAVHECGHALQHHDNQPTASIFNGKSYKVFFSVMLLVIIALFFIAKAYISITPGVFVIFIFALLLCTFLPNLIKRPYEHDASSRAVELLEEHAVFDSEEITIIRKMLKKQWHDPAPDTDTIFVD